jgi:glycosyltransferase involved in cell wall biosynthesis
MVDQIDVVHTFPLGSLQTLRTAKALGIPTVLERCNAHTRYAYEIVRRECERLGVTMPPGHEHAYNEEYLRREEEEYEAADYLLCPSEFVERTFVDRGFPKDKLVRFQYGYDPDKCYPASRPPTRRNGLTALFAAGCAPRKGLHHALKAWLESTASKDGTLLIAGEFIPGYAEALGSMLTHPSVSRIGFRHDLPEVMRNSDVLILPSIEEGSALVTYDARGSGCVLLVSDASGAVCTHMHNALVHPAGDTATLASHVTMLNDNRDLLETLRSASLETASELTWRAAGAKLHHTYHTVVATARSAKLSRV